MSCRPLHGTCCKERDDELVRRIGESFDLSADDHMDDYEKNGLSASSRILVGLFSENNRLAGRTVLDLGCGTGRFSIEALSNGAKSSVGMDLSPKMIEAAHKLSSRKNLDGRATFLIGDAAEVDHPVSDIVVLDKVVCCYPSIETLLVKASSAALDRLGLIVPRDTGIARVPVRIGVHLENLIDRVRRDPVRMYLHSLKKIDTLLGKSGLGLAKRRVTGFWLVLVYERLG